MTTPATKIVIVSGQEFSVPAATDNEAIRTQLSGMGFADVAAATIQKGKRTVEGHEVETIEFVKKAGTKGLSSLELAALLAKVPQAAYVARRHAGGDALLVRLAHGELTIAEALAHEDALADALLACHNDRPTMSKGAQLCEPCDRLPAAAAAPRAW